MTDTSSVLAELLQREPIFHRPELGTTQADFAAQMHPDFFEVGTSGRKYSREQILAILQERYSHSPMQAEQWLIRDADCRELAPSVYLLTYELTYQQRLTRRATLWQRTTKGWQILYHQGTLVAV